MFEKARGQFAVSLWDRNERTLILGRDRVGICPLYYTEVDGWLLWGSEIKAILASGMVAAKADPKGIDHLFTFFCAGTPEPLARNPSRFCPQYPRRMSAHAPAGRRPAACRARPLPTGHP